MLGAPPGFRYDSRMGVATGNVRDRTSLCSVLAVYEVSFVRNDRCPRITSWASYRSGSAPGPRASAFTLIELLVVVGIIALLLAILLPAFTGARDQARAAVCSARMREATRGAQLWVLEQQNDLRVPTNCGWAAGSLKEIQGQTEVFTCPSDPNPTPCPAFLVSMYRYTAGQPRFGSDPYALASPDSPFTKFLPDVAPGVASLGMEDRIGGSDLGNDADTDLVFKYTKTAGAKSTTVTLTGTSASDDFRLQTYKGKTIFMDLKAQGVGKPFQAPLLWGSYGLNIAAGYRNTKGMPILLVEYGKWAFFPEQIRVPPPGTGTWEMDTYATKFRPRHGRKFQYNSREANYYRDRTDNTYAPMDRANCGFLDGHVEPIPFKRLWRSTWVGAKPPRWDSPLWLGQRSGDPARFVPSF